jgi:hypothetical protein
MAYFASFRIAANAGGVQNGGWGGIRTHGDVAATPVFKTGALNHSATHPIGRDPLMKSGLRGKPAHFSPFGAYIDPSTSPDLP